MYQRWNRLGWVLVSGLTLYVVAQLIRSVNYGAHWDEWIQEELVFDAWSNMSLIPDNFYNYPSATFDLGMLARAVLAVLDGLGWTPTTEQTTWYLITRSLLITLTALGGLALYSAGRRLSGPWAGVVAAGVYLFSWQLNFHSRWIAPDALLAGASAGFLALLVYRWQSPERQLPTHLPAFAAGIAAATKYQGAALLIPAVLEQVIISRRTSLGMPRTIKAVIGDVLAALLAFVILTPGALLQTSAFVQDIAFEGSHYRGDHGEWLGVMHHLPGRGWPYVQASLAYLSNAVVSEHWLVNASALAFVILGVIHLWRSDRWLLVIIVSAPAALMVYYSTLSVWIARNFLLFFGLS